MSLITLTSNNTTANDFKVRLPNNLKLAPYSQVKLIGGSMGFIQQVMIDDSNDTWAIYEQYNYSNNSEIGWTKAQFIKLEHGVFRMHKSTTVPSPPLYGIGSLINNFLKSFYNQCTIPMLSMGYGTPISNTFISITGTGKFQFSIGKAVNDLAPSSVMNHGGVNNWRYVNTNVNIPAVYFTNEIMAVAPTASTTGNIGISYQGNNAILGAKVMYPSCNSKTTATLRHPTCRPLFTHLFDYNWIANSNGARIGIFNTRSIFENDNIPISQNWCGADYKSDNMFYSIGFNGQNIIISYTTINENLDISDPGYYTKLDVDTGITLTNDANYKMIGAYTFYDNGVAAGTTGTRGYRIQFIFSDNYPSTPTQLSASVPPAVIQPTIINGNIQGIGATGALTSAIFTDSYLIPKQFYKEGDGHIRVGHINPSPTNNLAVGSKIQIRTIQLDGVNNTHVPSVKNDYVGYYGVMNNPYGEIPNAEESGETFIDKNPSLFNGCNLGNTLGYTLTGNQNIFTGTNQLVGNMVIAQTNYATNNGNNSDLYLEIPELGIKSLLGNNSNGKYQSVISPIYFKLQNHTRDTGEWSFEAPADIFCNLNNAQEKNINTLTCRLITANGILYEGMVGNTNLTIYVREDPVKSIAIEYKKMMVNMNQQIKESMNIAINQKISETRI